MNENKFTPRAEEALRLSQEAAGELGHGYVGSAHLLIALARQGDRTGNLLRAYGADPVLTEQITPVLQQLLGK